jgi:histidine triad (HIT) family protein
MEPDCVFCKIASGALSAPKFHEDEWCVAFPDIEPKAPTHVLIVPKEHRASTAEIDAASEPLVGHLVAVAAALARERGLNHGYRLVLNTGADAGQTVPHLHLHLLGGRPLGDMG